MKKKEMLDKIDMALDGFKYDLENLIHSNTYECEEDDRVLYCEEAIQQMKCAYYTMKQMKKYLKQKDKK